MLRRLFGIIFVVVVVSGSAILTKQLSPTQQITDYSPSQPKQIVTGPGLHTLYNPDTSSWVWQYGQELQPGCQKFRLDPKAVRAGEGELIAIYLQKYVVDENCEESEVLASMSGHISHSQYATFAVYVDGELVAQSSKKE